MRFQTAVFETVIGSLQF